MKFESPLVPAVLIQRYKRFLFDAVLEDGRVITGFCPNTGSMRGLTTPGSKIWLSEHDSPTRKYRHMLELVEVEGAPVGINTGLPNQLAGEAIAVGLVGDLASYPLVRREQRYGRNSRIDFLLSEPDGSRRCYVEVKNVHFSRETGLAEFPDSPTTRGAKHLEELGDMVAEGHRAAMLYLVQRADCSRFRICGDLDPVYARAYIRARQRGVETFSVRCSVSPTQIVADSLIPIDETAPAGL